MISKPNDWKSTIQNEAKDLSGIRQVQLQFWTALKQYMEDAHSFVGCQKPLPQHFMNHAPGKAGIHLTSIISTCDPELNKNSPQIRAEVYMNGSKAKEMFDALAAQKDSIEKQVGFQLTWQNPQNAAFCRIVTHESSDFTNNQLWPEQFSWLRHRLEVLHLVFSLLVKAWRF